MNGDIQPGTDGMSLRDYFASKFLSFTVNEDMTRKEAEEIAGVAPAAYNSQTHWPVVVARRAYAYADAMVAERSRQ